MRLFSCRPEARGVILGGRGRGGKSLSGAGERKGGGQTDGSAVLETISMGCLRVAFQLHLIGS